MRLPTSEGSHDSMSDGSAASSIQELKIFPVGLLIMLIAAALLRKSDFLPANEPASG